MNTAWPHDSAQMRGNVDNSLNPIHNNLCYFIQNKQFPTFEKVSKNLYTVETWDECIRNRKFNHSLVKYISALYRFDFKDIDGFPACKVINNFMSESSARETRDFVCEIPFDNTLSVINNTDNLPRDSVNTLLKTNDYSLIYETLKTKNVTEPCDWMWERYSSSVWRAVPLTITAFCNSTIFHLMFLLERVIERWMWSLFSNTKFLPLTWVLQRMENGCSVSKHTDNSYQEDKDKERHFSFIYYLTPDDWDYVKDGGELIIENENLTYTFNPTFNSLICWNIRDYEPLVHSVNEVKSSSKIRIALVGFYHFTEK